MSEIWDVYDEHGNKTGRFHERGKPMQKGDYHLVVNVWIANSKNEFLVSRRAVHKNHMWHTTGGAAVAGDDSFTTALKEVKEEIGIDLNPENGQFFKRCLYVNEEKKHNAFIDVWFFRQDVDINTTVLQEEEICDVMYCSKDEIIKMKENGHYDYSYLDEMFEFFGV